MPLNAGRAEAVFAACLCALMVFLAVPRPLLPRPVADVRAAMDLGLGTLNLYVGQAVFTGTNDTPWKVVATCPSIVVTAPAVDKRLAFDSSALCDEDLQRGYRFLMDGRYFVVYRYYTAVMGGMAQDDPANAAKMMDQLGVWACQRVGETSQKSEAVAWVLRAENFRHITTGEVKRERTAIYTFHCGLRRGVVERPQSYEEVMRGAT